MLGPARTIRILTQDEDGDTRKTKIWVAAVDEQLYIRTADTRWFHNLERGSSLTVVHAKQEYPAVAVRIEDAATVQLVHAAFRKKHRISDPMVGLFGGGTNVFRLDAPAQP